MSHLLGLVDDIQPFHEHEVWRRNLNGDGDSRKQNPLDPTNISLGANLMSAGLHAPRAGPQTPIEKIKMLSKLLLSARARNVVKVIKWFKKVFFADRLKGNFGDKAFAEKFWNDHLTEVKASVPADKLLIYDVRDGWAPLCKFLGVKEPKDPIPHLNKKENFKEMLPKLMKGKMV